MKSLRIAALLILAASAPALAQKMLVATLSHEALPDQVRMPDSQDSELTLQICATCKVLRLRASSATRYFVGQEEVTLAVMKKYVDQHPDAPMVVSQATDAPTLLSVRISATTSAR